MKSRGEVSRILKRLGETYPARSALRYRTPFQLLAAAVLSAQSTDEQVNRVTEKLFAAFPDAPSLSQAEPRQIQEIIRGVGLHEAKSRHLVEAARMLVEKHGGRVPRTREELMLLPGVGRKTANVVLNNAFAIPAIGVDTHVFRVSNRLGLANSGRVRETEQQLEEVVPIEKWGGVHHWLIWHGREVCQARRPRCEECMLAEWCDFYKNIKKD